MKNTRNSYMDLLRCISSFLVVMLHVSAGYWNQVDVNSNTFFSMTFYNGLTRGAVPVFIMISGMFLLDKESKPVALFNRIFKLLCSFYLWSFFYAFQGIAFDFVTTGSFSEEDFASSIHRFLFGHYHQWFLLMLVGLYILIPILKKICEDKRITEYFLLLWFLFNIVIPVFSKNSFIVEWAAYLQFIITGFVGYFVLGNYLAKNNFSKKIRFIMYMLGIAGTVYTIIATVTFCRKNNVYDTTFYNSMSWNILFVAIAGFVLFNNLQKNKSWHNKHLTQLSRASLVVYMIHPFFIEKLDALGINTIMFNSWLSIPILSIIIYFASNLIGLLCFYIYDKITHKKEKTT